MKEVALELTLEKVQETLLSMDSLAEAEGIGIFGSLARGEVTHRSDIDVFVIVENKRNGLEDDSLWWERIKKILRPFGRDVTVLVYSLKGLRNIGNWYVLRLASEGIIVYDRGRVGQIFKEIHEAARRAGLIQIKRGDAWVWAKEKVRFGEVFQVKVKGDNGEFRGS